jgi:carboxypeptidase C (cathepsin A)
MRKGLIIILACTFYSISLLQAQNARSRDTSAVAKEEKIAASPSRTLNPDHKVVTNHEVTIKGQKIPYKVVTGTQPVWDEEGKVIASLFYIYYERTDVKDRASRPLVISFNGGPGSASVWMHIAYTGPRVLQIDDEG